MKFILDVPHVGRMHGPEGAGEKEEAEGEKENETSTGGGLQFGFF